VCVQACGEVVNGIHEALPARRGAERLVNLFVTVEKYFERFFCNSTKKFLAFLSGAGEAAGSPLSWKFCERIFRLPNPLK
jgi:hypothetical protein